MENSVQISFSWQEELERRAKKYHTIAAWVAVVFNPLFAFGDYMIIPHLWKEALGVRLIVSFATLVVLLINLKKDIPSPWIIFVPYIGIALENAYMYSNTLEVEKFQQHTFAYLAFFIGCAMLVLWPMIYSILGVVVAFTANLVLFPIFSTHTFEEVFTNGGMLTAVVAIFSIFLVQIRYSLTKREIMARLALDKEKKRSEGLLLNILPVEVADELKENGKSLPKSYEKVTVMFTDFSGFTKIAEKMSPEQLVQELDYCFNAFDEIVMSYGLEKIKTIGDAYMCAGGIPLKSDDNALKVTKAALEIRDWMEQWKKDKQEKGEEVWEIRIGLHTGRVVAGVVGKNKFAYDIWGDAVNTAARMESSGGLGEVNVSQATYEEIKDHFDCQFRGKQKAKNKGELEMYFVNPIH